MVSPIELQISDIEGYPKVKLIKLIGELDITNSLKTSTTIMELISSDTPFIIADCELLSYIDSAGAHSFLEYSNQAKKKKGLFVFINVKDDVYRVCHMLGFPEVLTFCKNMDEALARFK